MKVVITDTVMITSLGLNVNECFKAICSGEHGLSSIRSIKKERFNQQNSYEVHDVKNNVLKNSELLQKVLFNILSTNSDLSSNKVCVIIGTGLGETRGVERWYENEIELNAENLVLSNVIEDSSQFQNVFTIVNACSASNYALGLAEDLIRLGEAEAVIVIGCDVIVESMNGYLDRGNTIPPNYLRAFDVNRTGTILGEGGAAIIVESDEHAIKRGKKPKAILRSVGLNCDAFHETAPDVEGITIAMKNALVRSGLTSTDIDLIYAHGTGTILNDPTEIKALKKVYGDRLKSIPITGIKGAIGHTSGASGLIGVICAIESMTQSIIPPTLFIDNQIEESKELLIVKESIHEAICDTVQINSFGFGGVNAVVLLERWTE